MKNPLIRRLRIMLLALSFVIDYWKISRLERESELHGQRIDEICRLAGARMRNTAFALQGVIVKVGQFLSMREDLLPKSFVNELKDLQDTMPAEPFAVVRPLVEKVLGRKLGTIFTDFDKDAIAAASLAQVHKAKLASGETVAVKILRPNIGRFVKVDLGTLLLVSKIAHRFPSVRRKMNLVDLHREFSEIVSREVDCIQEQEQLYRFREMFQNDKRIHVPKVFEALTRREIIVMEYIDGAKITDMHTWNSWGVEPEQVVNTLLDSYFMQLLSRGFVHLDPHPGNLYVLRDGRVCFLDFGMVGIFNDKELGNFRRLLQAIVMKKADALVASLDALGFFPDSADTGLFVSKVDNLLKGISFPSGGKTVIQVSKTIGLLKSIIIDSPIQLQAKYMFLVRTTTILVAILRDLLPTANWPELVMEHAIPVMMAPVGTGRQG